MMERLEAVESSDPAIEQARRERAKVLRDELAAALAERGHTPDPFKVKRERAKGSSSARRAIDPDAEAERSAIRELGLAELQARELGRRTDPQPTIGLGDIMRAELREAKRKDPEAQPDWAAWQRVIGAVELPISGALSENRKQSFPPTKSNKFLGVGRGGKWWAGARAKLGPLDTEGERLGLVDRELGRGRLEAVEVAAEVAAGTREAVPFEPAADADGRDPYALDWGWWQGQHGKGAPAWWKGRREAHRLRVGLLRSQADRQANCRRYPLGGRVGLRQHRERLPDGTSTTRLAWAGMETCGSVWSCPECSRIIRTRRAQELGQLDEWAGERAYLVTLTVAHAMGDDLEELRRGVANAWRRTIAGAPWRRFVERCEIKGFVRALEVKHGPHGWHPHLHAVVVGRLAWPSARIAGRSAKEWLAERWRSAVMAELGPKHAPSLEHGCEVGTLRGSGYLVKMGLELCLDWTKRDRIDERCPRRIPWQIAADWVRFRELADRELWIAYAQGIKGARQLTWSKGLRELAGLPDEQSDETIAEEGSGVEVGSVDRPDWEWLSKGKGECGYPWTAHALEIGEVLGLEAMAEWIERKRRKLDARSCVLVIGRKPSKERANHEKQADDRQGERSRGRAGEGNRWR